ncbi:MAG: hypothetical protein KBD37_03450 [Burkholderiales bacterium]|nr:hypothetical protein [Burkholderiales bacterium]
MAKHYVNNSRTIILGRGKESSSALQQLVNRSIQLKNEIVSKNKDDIQNKINSKTNNKN